MYRGWQVPLRQPWNYNTAQNMFMLSQTLPGFQSFWLRGQANVAFEQIQEALVQTKAAQKLASIYERSLRPQAEAGSNPYHDPYESDTTARLRQYKLQISDSYRATLDCR